MCRKIDTFRIITNKTEQKKKKKKEEEEEAVSYTHLTLPTNAEV